MNVVFKKPLDERLYESVEILIEKLQTYGHIITEVESVKLTYTTKDIYAFGRLRGSTLIVNEASLLEGLIKNDGEASPIFLMNVAYLINAVEEVRMRSDNFFNNPPYWAKEFVRNQ